LCSSWTSIAGSGTPRNIGGLILVPLGIKIPPGI
jgi:hypothetical protein